MSWQQQKQDQARLGHLRCLFCRQSMKSSVEEEARQTVGKFFGSEFHLYDQASAQLQLRCDTQDANILHICFVQSQACIN